MAKGSSGARHRGCRKRKLKQRKAENEQARPKAKSYHHYLDMKPEHRWPEDRRPTDTIETGDEL